MNVVDLYKRQITVAHIFGIPVRFDYRWFIVFLLSVRLIAMNLARGGMWVSQVQLVPVSTTTAWILGVVTTLGLFLMLPAMMADYPAVGGVLFLLGAGNLLLAIFNLFPGYPLDGGLVLRAILWRRTGDIKEATRLAGICGMLIAAILIIFGVYMAIAPNFRAYFMGFWSVLVGLFLFDAAYSVVKHVRCRLRNIVSEAMSAPFAIEPDTLISQLIDSILPMHRQVAFPVAHERRLHGMLSLEDLKALPRDRWHITRARDVMRPIAPRFFVEPNATLAYAQESMKRNGIGSVAVVGKTGGLVGFLQSGKFKRVKRK